MANLPAIRTLDDALAVMPPARKITYYLATGAGTLLGLGVIVLLGWLFFVQLPWHVTLRGHCNYYETRCGPRRHWLTPLEAICWDIGWGLTLFAAVMAGITAELNDRHKKQARGY